MELTQEPLWHDAGCQRSALDGHVFGGAHVPAVERLNELEVAAVLARLRRPLPVAAAFTFWIADQRPLRTEPQVQILNSHGGNLARKFAALWLAAVAKSSRAVDELEVQRPTCCATSCAK